MIPPGRERSFLYPHRAVLKLKAVLATFLRIRCQNTIRAPLATLHALHEELPVFSWFLDAGEIFPVGDLGRSPFFEGLNKIKN